MINNKFILRSAKHVYSKVSPAYYGTLRQIKSTEYKSRKVLDNWQLNRLKRALINAYEKSPYYRESFEEAGVHPFSFSRLEDIQKYPFMTKEIYRANIVKVLTKNARNPFLIEAFTGGTTGLPVPVYRNAYDFAREKAFTAYAYKMLEMDLYCKTVYIRGQVNDNNGIYKKITNNGKMMYLSSHNMTDSSLELYVSYIREFKPKLLYTLPSIAMILAGFMKRNNIAPFTGLEWAFCPSENLYDFQKEFIEEVLQCRVGNLYGHSEHAVMASRCIGSNNYHVLPQYGFAELIDKDGNVVQEEGRLGEIVGTSFTNPGCPFVRYRTGDYAVYTTAKCGCGRKYQMWERIEGRAQDIAYGKNGESISMGPDFLCTIFDSTYMKIKQFKIEQRNVGKLNFLVLPHKENGIEEIQKYFKRLIREEYPNCFDIEVDLLEESDLNVRDKHRFFIQHVKKESMAFAEEKISAFNL